MRSRRHSRSKEAPELDITAFLNLMVVLVPFLLVSAVFSRVTILELNMPTGAGGGAEDPGVTLEVVVRKDVLEISDGSKVIARFPNLNRDERSVAEGDTGPAEVPVDEYGMPIVPPTEEVYDLVQLREYLVRIKQTYPDKTDSTLLMEPEVAYEHLVGVMDTVRSAQVVSTPEEGTAPDPEAEAETETMELFPDISLGDAP